MSPLHTPDLLNPRRHLGRLIDPRLSSSADELVKQRLLGRTDEVRYESLSSNHFSFYGRRLVTAKTRGRSSDDVPLNIYQHLLLPGIFYSEPRVTFFILWTLMAFVNSECYLIDGALENQTRLICMGSFFLSFFFVSVPFPDSFSVAGSESKPGHVLPLLLVFSSRTSTIREWQYVCHLRTSHITPHTR